MASQRGPDWDYYQCKCGNILFEYNVVTGEKFLSDTWRDCTTSCMEPVSHVPPCARPFTTNARQVPPSVRCMGSQTDEVCGSSSIMTQTSPCGCSSSSVDPGVFHGDNQSVTRTSFSTSNTELANKNESIVSSDSNVEKPLAVDEGKQAESRSHDLDITETSEMEKNSEGETVTKELKDKDEGLSQGKIMETFEMQKNPEGETVTQVIKDKDEGLSQRKVAETSKMQKNPGNNNVLSKQDPLVKAAFESKNRNTNQGPPRSNDPYSDDGDKIKNQMQIKSTSDRVLRKRKPDKRDEDKKSITKVTNQSPKRSKRRSKS